MRSISRSRNPGPQKYWLSPHVYACWPDGGTVLLDLKKNRYLGLNPDDSRTLRHLLGYPDRPAATATSRPDQPPLCDDTAGDLVAAGVLVPYQPDRIIRGALVDVDGTLASIGYGGGRSAQIELHHVFNHARACLWAKRALHMRSFYSVACEVSRTKELGLRRGLRTDDEVLTDLVLAFRKLRAFTFTARNHCLFHALALTRFLSMYGFFPTWVIGVTITPWAAHSWVQHNQTILDATPEHIAAFTPILAI